MGIKENIRSSLFSSYGKVELTQNDSFDRLNTAIHQGKIGEALWEGAAHTVVLEINNILALLSFVVNHNKKDDANTLEVLCAPLKMFFIALPNIVIETAKNKITYSSNKI